ncbi:MAG: ABC transporter permease [Gammaproteobacteria bacterium CG_4_10_14_0_8_um_filter_38_16]|nr:MAG: ABC transporter permease [Gammaproteobacteria bacterium CG_4_10_14_0_8_um_filter_38_16]PJA04414.1 MAG: ABC transporter permease [Gammaproteobacteria bacterium CG_4_10_14_0_2_um_filter_38_22]PJB10164.1 MAG: ABC transporter permease [Gammaproteobacteria bacterium CG_4_9_14_3_um_filter_38_9]
MLTILLNTLQQTLIFLPLAIGVYLSYDVLLITDLTVEGTFVLGAAIFARLITLGLGQTLSVIAGLLGGAIIGIGVTVMQRVAKINSLIAGILATFMLYSVNFGVMNRPNISLLNSDIFLQHLQDYYPVGLTFFLIAFILLLTIAMSVFLHSEMGLKLRAFGSSPHLLRKLGKNPAIYLGIGLATSNMLSALCGIMTAQVDGYADIHMGLGMALTAIGAVVIGKKLVSALFRRSDRFSASAGLFGCLLGAFIYFLILNGFLTAGINPIYLKLFLGLILVVFLSTAHYTKQRGELYATAD